MKGHVIWYTGSNLLISDQTYWLVIVILKLVIWMNRVDIRITIIQTVQNFVEFRPLKDELLSRQSSSSMIHFGWSVRTVCVCGLLGKMVGIEQGSLEYKQISSSWILLQLDLVLLDFFIYIYNHFLLFIVASVAANHKSNTELQCVEENRSVLNKTAGVLKYGPDKIGAGVVERW